MRKRIAIGICILVLLVGTIGVVSTERTYAEPAGETLIVRVQYAGEREEKIREKIRFTSGTDWEYGTAVAIDEDGGLIVEKEDHTQEILRTGEITVRVC